MFIELNGVPQFIDCGKLVSTFPFLHAERTNNDYLLLIGMEGILSIRVGDIPYSINPKDIMLIPPQTPIAGNIDVYKRQVYGYPLRTY